MSRTEGSVLALLIVAIVGSALGVVWVKHQNRKAFAELSALRDERDALEVEWDKLLLEQSAWATTPRIEQVAASQLSMTVPSADQVVVVRP
jgi:cell division protein FtsL